MIAKNGLDLSLMTVEQLERKLKVELYRDIDSEVAKEILQELESRIKE
jgi:hypothetical protein